MLEKQQAELEKAIAEIKMRYQPQLDQLQRDSDILRGDIDRPGDVGAVVGVDVKIEWKEHKIAFDVPAVKMVDRGFSFDLPEVRMKEHRISFDVPEVVMVDEVVGYYPEVTWKGVKWKPIIISRPKVRMRRKEIIFGLPEVKMTTKRFSLDIPEFSMHREEWKFHVPEVTVVNVRGKAKEWEARGNDLKVRGDAITEAMKAEIEAAIATFNASVGGTTQGESRAVTDQFDNALQAIDKAIKDLIAQGVDPIKVPGEGGDINLRKMYSELLAQRDAFEQRFREVAASQPNAA
jgi:hypothetical protein